MRPARFHAYLTDLANQHPGTTARHIPDHRGIAYPYALAITTPRGEVRWQIIGRLAPGEHHDTPETPIHAEPPVLTHPSPPDDTPEAWLTDLLIDGRCPEIQSIERWSTRPDPSNQSGLTLLCHNGARIYIRAL